MAAFNYTQTETLLGNLTNGRKIVMVEIAITDNGLVATQITSKYLQRIIAWTLGLAVPLLPTFVCADGTNLNQVSVTPSADATGVTLQILAVGV